MRRQLAELELERAQKIIFRARTNWARYGERSSRYFLNLEKRKSKGKTVSKLITKDNKELMDPQEILEYECTFYEKLYSQDDGDLTQLQEDHPFRDCPRISALKKDYMDRPISAPDLREALKQLHTGKCRIGRFKRQILC